MQSFAYLTLLSVASALSFVSLPDEDGNMMPAESYFATATGLPAPYGNTTTTVTTITDYTTYCPEPTTITITTCNEACYPTTITVVEPTTIVVPGECIVPVPVPVTSTEEPEPTEPTVEPTAPFPGNDTETPGNGTAPIPTYDNGANKQIIGLSAFAVIGAFLL